MKTFDESKLRITDNQPYFLFTHNGQTYILSAWLEDSKDEIYQACLSIPKYHVSDDYYTAWNVTAVSASNAKITESGGVVEFVNNVFIPMINDYLSEQGESEINSETFPENALYFIQFGWLLENKISYNDGKIFLTE